MAAVKLAAILSSTLCFMLYIATGNKSAGWHKTGEELSPHTLTAPEQNFNPLWAFSLSEAYVTEVHQC